MNESDLVWLLHWLQSQSKAGVEHRESISIEALDNPGWFIFINLEHTKLENKIFNKIEIENSDNDWLVCFVEDKIFKGCGGPFNFSEVLYVFRNWVEN